MAFLHKYLHLNIDDTLRIALSAASHVSLMDDENYRLYQGGEEYDYFGDLVKRSPYSIDAPAAGYWHLVIEPLVEGVPLTVAVQKIEG